jgi:carboxymethylenebutenolidase
MPGSRIAITAADGGTFNAYVAAPETGSGPGLLIFHAIFGVNQVVRDVADRFASQGYLAVCPDLFWRQSPDVELSEKREEDWARGLQLFQGFDADKGIADLASALRAVRSMPGSRSKIGCVGYCFGGRMAYLMAACHDIDAAVSYYGTAIENHLDLAPRISRPLMLHLAAEDRYVPADVQGRIRAALDGNPSVTLHTYEGVDHAFARVGAPSFDQRAADLANQRTAQFLQTHLGTNPPRSAS